ncbi:MAG: DUF1223 domain-containing protein, partial [Pseudomonadota bacterium]
LLASWTFAEDRTPVVVELFTSEGCSSCPPADAILEHLDHAQPIAGVEIIALEQHVDYWNQLGWFDPFSSPALSARQQAYASAFHSDNIYTPQMVINGRAEFVGNDLARARQEILRAALAPRAVVKLEARTGSILSLRVEDLPATRHRVGLADVLLAVTETGLADDVKRGENAGQRLRHAAIVRSLTTVGSLDPRRSASFSTDVKLNLARSWKRENLRAVLLVEERRSRRILGAASAGL